MSSAATIAAVVTALEAVSTDLLGLGVPSSSEPSVVVVVVVRHAAVRQLGVILINAAWAGKKEALDILEKMIEVTMMRGAQSGGVVTYASGPGGGNPPRASTRRRSCGASGPEWSTGSARRYQS